MSNFTNKIDELQTSLCLLSAIYEVAGCDDAIAMRIWESPTATELQRIIELVTANGNPTSEYLWGASGSNWANS